jgi:hypothetical protein
MGLMIARSEPDVHSSWNALDQAIHDADRWCAAHIDPTQPRHGLWTEGCAPNLLHDGRFDVIRDVVRARGSSVRHRDVGSGPAGGRLLAYFPDLDLVDGAAEVESGGFFDVHNTPPWDTWVAYVEDERPASSMHRCYLVAWVPRALVPAAQAGIDVNPEECILWLDDTPTALAAALRERGGVFPSAPPLPAEPLASRVPDPPKRGGWLRFFRTGGS